ncbi:hypothetical protein C8R45DRAFT_970692, partial [Mycena sanguinolenta]
MTARISWRSDLGRDTLDKIVKVVPAWKDGLRPVQADLVAAILYGDDVLCCTATGDGKSAAFSIPILVLSKRIQHEFDIVSSRTSNAGWTGRSSGNADQM